PRKRGPRPWPWIPACAGMNGVLPCARQCPRLSAVFQSSEEKSQEVAMKRLVLLAAAAMSLAATGAQAQEKLKIGIIATLSGPPAVLGQQLRNGFNLAVKTLDGKLGGRDVEVIVADDELKPDLAVTKVKALVERDKIEFVVGPIFSNILAAIMKPATEGGAILISPNAGTSNFAGKECNPNFFVTSYQNDQVFAVSGKHAQDSGIKKVFL